MAGCKPAPAANKAVQPKSEPQVVHTGPATFDKVGPQGEKLWTVQWKSAQATIYDQSEFGGSIEGLTGDIFRGGRAICSFSADSGTIERGSDDLAIDGHVVVTSLENGSVLHCDHMRYVAKLKQIRANGGIRLSSSQGTLDGIPELWTTPELKFAASPELWGGRR